jgi:hypothetical protein
MRCLPSSVLLSSSFFASPIFIKKNLRKLQGYKDPPLWPTYIGERRTTFAKAYGINVRCYQEHVKEHLGILGIILKT